VVGISRGRGKFNTKQKKKGRRRGQGSRKGAKYARFPKKNQWIRTIRALRRFLRSLRDEGRVNKSDYRKYYRKAKGGEFRSKHHLNSHLISDGILKEEKKQ
jgi:large subunit ribosomal protein L19e